MPAPLLRLTRSSSGRHQHPQHVSYAASRGDPYGGDHVGQGQELGCWSTHNDAPWSIGSTSKFERMRPRSATMGLCCPEAAFRQASGRFRPETLPLHGSRTGHGPRARPPRVPAAIVAAFNPGPPSSVCWLQGAEQYLKRLQAIKSFDCRVHQRGAQVSFAVEEHLASSSTMQGSKAVLERAGGLGRVACSGRVTLPEPRAGFLTAGRQLYYAACPGHGEPWEHL